MSMKQETKPIDWTKPLMFRNKPERTNVRFVGDLHRAVNPKKLIIFTREDGDGDFCTRDEDGRSQQCMDLDIINAPEVKVFYRNTYNSGVATQTYDTAESAAAYGIQWKEFEGVLRFTYEDGKLTKVELV